MKKLSVVNGKHIPSDLQWDLRVQLGDFIYLHHGFKKMVLVFKRHHSGAMYLVCQINYKLPELSTALQMSVWDGNLYFVCGKFVFVFDILPVFKTDKFQKYNLLKFDAKFNLKSSNIHLVQNFAFIGKGTINVRRKADHLGVQTGETEVIRKSDLQEHQQFQSRVDPDFP